MMAASPIVQYQPLPPANLVRPLPDLHQNSPPIPLPSKIIILIIVTTLIGSDFTVVTKDS